MGTRVTHKSTNHKRTLSKLQPKDHNLSTKNYKLSILNRSARAKVRNAYKSGTQISTLSHEFNVSTNTIMRTVANVAGDDLVVDKEMLRPDVDTDDRRIRSLLALEDQTRHERRIRRCGPGGEEAARDEIIRRTSIMQKQASTWESIKRIQTKDRARVHRPISKSRELTETSESAASIDTDIDIRSVTPTAVHAPSPQVQSAPVVRRSPRSRPQNRQHRRNNIMSNEADDSDDGLPSASEPHRTDTADSAILASKELASVTDKYYHFDLDSPSDKMKLKNLNHILEAEGLKSDKAFDMLVSSSDDDQWMMLDHLRTTWKIGLCECLLLKRDLERKARA